MRATPALIAFLVLLAPAAAETDAEKGRRIITESGSPAGVWNVEADGTVVHRASGVRCVLKQPTSTLEHVFNYESRLGPGTDVGCDYARGTFGHYAAKFTVFVVKIAKGETLDSIYARYLAEVKQASPGARSLGPAIKLQQDVPEDHPDRLPDVRSEEFEISLGGNPSKTALAVSVVGEWAVEVRATYPLGTAEGLMDEPALIVLWLAAVSDLKAQ